MFLVQYSGLNQLPFDPANNNEPLQFGSASGPLVTEGLIENGGESSKKRKRTNAPSADNSRTLNVDSTAMTLPMSDPTAWATAMNNLGMAPLGIAGQPILPDFDPALGMMTGIPPITPMMPGLGIVPPPIPPDMPVVKEIIHCKSCTLFPPNPNLPPPATRERPPGCKTVFVGGLPENGTEQIIVEVFEQCGEIIAIRKSKKNFCHIRFAEEYMVDKALYLSALVSQAEALKEENDSLRWQLDAYRNEVELLKQEQGKAHREDDPNKEQQLKLLQQALQGMQQHLLKVQEEYKRKEAELEKIKDDKLQVEKMLENLKEKESCASRLCTSSQDSDYPLEKTLNSCPVKSEREALLVGIISTFLHVHPFGASIEYICSYLHRLDNKICTSDVECLMSRLQHTFKQEMTGVGASLEKRWKFCGFEGLKLT